MAIIENIFIQDTLTLLAEAVFNGDIYPDEDQLCYISNEQKFYVLIDGFDGDQVTDWQPLSQTTATFPEYVSTQPYNVGDCVFFNGTFFVCTTSAAAGETPITHPEKYSTIPLGFDDVVAVSFTAQTEVDVVHNKNISSVLTFVERNGSLIQSLSHVEFISASTIKVRFNNPETGIIRVQ